MNDLKTSLRSVAVISSAYLFIFLAGKLLWNDNPDLPILDWLLDTTPWNHSYLFGWLIMHERFLKCSLLSILTALWGKQRFAAATFTGFSAGLLLGEGYHFLFWNPESSGIALAWVIWVVCFAVSILLGCFLEWRKKRT